MTSSTIVNIYYQAAGATGGVVLASLLLVCLLFGGHAAFTVSTRCVFAIARDRALPVRLAHVNTLSNLPTYTLGCVFLSSVLLQTVRAGGV